MLSLPSKDLLCSWKPQSPEGHIILSKSTNPAGLPNLKLRVMLWTTSIYSGK